MQIEIPAEAAELAETYDLDVEVIARDAIAGAIELAAVRVAEKEVSQARQEARAAVADVVEMLREPVE